MGSNAAKTWRVTVNEDGSGSICARVRNPSASYITQATVSSISVNYRRRDRTGSTTTTSLTVASVVFDTLQTDNFWKDINGVSYDSLGYNFRWDFGASVFTEPSAIYGVTFTFTPSSGGAYPLNVEVSTNPKLA